MARFIDVYGATAFDRGRIPATLFFLLWHQIPALAAGHRLESAEAIRLGLVMRDQPKETRVKAELRRLERIAVPLEYPSREGE